MPHSVLQHVKETFPHMYSSPTLFIGMSSHFSNLTFKTSFKTNIFMLKSFIRRFQNVLIYLSSISSYQDKMWSWRLWITLCSFTWFMDIENMWTKLASFTLLQMRKIQKLEFLNVYFTNARFLLLCNQSLSTVIANSKFPFTAQPHSTVLLWQPAMSIFQCLWSKLC